MKAFKIIILYVLFFIFPQMVFCENFQNEDDNYLTGMSVAKNFAGDYYVRLKLKNNTSKKYKLKDLGNNSYVLIMPQVKSEISEEDINFENDHDDLKIIFSENINSSDKSEFYTKINFKTKNESIIKVEAFAPKLSVKNNITESLSAPENINTDNISTTEKSDTDKFQYLLFLPVGILSLISIIFLFRSPEENVKKEEKNKEIKTASRAEITVTDRNVFFNSITPPEKTYSFEQLNPLTDENVNQTDIVNNSESVYDLENLQTLNSALQQASGSGNAETDLIIDELVKIVIPKNDLILMPGVPELPGLDASGESLYELNSIQMKIPEKNIDVQNDLNYIQPESFYADEVIKEADNIIFEERSMFFNSISPLPRKTQSEKVQENTNFDTYETLLRAFKKVLTIAHKIKDENIPEPEIIDAFAIDDDNGFSLVKYGSKVSLVGNLSSKIFLIRTFNIDELNNDTLFMEFCTQTPLYSTYSVILNKFKALIKVTENDISLIGEYD